jgi:shikimate dehydrogenase
MRLGLIGDAIAASQMPRLQKVAGAQLGRPVRYERLVPREQGLGFDALFDRCREEGMRGVNVTYPYKERAARRVTPADEGTLALGAVNTVLFEATGPLGHNTDHSGFVQAWRAARGGTTPGAVCILGAGGVGRAVAFALLALGAEALRLADRDAEKAEALASALRSAGGRASVHASARDAAEGAHGLVNCTPVGMVGHDGTPLEARAMRGAAWAFDAVYTPAETPFLRDAERAGLTVISGWELFFWQGIHAAALYHGRAPDAARLRGALRQPV